LKATRLDLDGLVMIEPDAHHDSRGSFFESFNEREFEKATGFSGRFVQDNHSISGKGVLRGLHYQLPPHPQGKLVRVVAGAVFEVAVDVRRSSQTFGKWFSIELNGLNRLQLWVPPGFAHGFLALEAHSEVLYKATDFWDPSCERSIRWDDPDIGVRWPMETEPTVSAKDARAVLLGDADLFA